MLKNIILNKSAEKLGIVNPVVARYRGIVLRKDVDSLQIEKKELIEYLELNSDKIKSSDIFRGFKILFESMGYKDQLTAGERLLNFFLQNGFKSINNVIDACNIISAKHGCGIGLHDSGKISEDIVIKRAQDKLQILPIFKDKFKSITEGDLVYMSGNNVIAWLGKRDVDSELFKITEQTDELIFVALGNKYTSAEFNKSLCEEYFRLLKKENQCTEMEYLNLLREQ